MRLPVYLDYASTTPVDRRVLRKMVRYMTRDGRFGNAAALQHRYGWEADEAVAEARRSIAELINAEPEAVIFTSGTTESNNLAIKGITATGGKEPHIVTGSTEHSSVLEVCAYLERNGASVTRLSPGRGGTITPAQLDLALSDKTTLVTLMHVNNETGTIQDVESLGKVCRTRGITFHVDAAQSIGRMSVDVTQLPIDLMSFSAHKIYGPKGVGVLYVRREIRERIETQMHGGGQEFGLRSGTLPVHQIVGMGEACKILSHTTPDEVTKLRTLCDELWSGLQQIAGTSVNGCPVRKVPSILNITFHDFGEQFLPIVLRNLAVSSSSSCTANDVRVSHVLLAMGLDPHSARNSVRFSIGRYTTSEEIEFAVRCVQEIGARVRKMGSPSLQPCSTGRIVHDFTSSRQINPS